MINDGSVLLVISASLIGRRDGGVTILFIVVINVVNNIDIVVAALVGVRGVVLKVVYSLGR